MRYSTHICERFQHGAEILGKRWTGLIIKLLLPGPRRFGELAGALEVVSDRVISERLKELEREGIVERRVYPETPVRIEYALTETGVALAPVIDALQAWSERWVEPAPVVED